MSGGAPPASGGLAEIHRAHRLLVCVGPGGVGKTTLAAALALDAARDGRRVFLLTIDPARRLADALGLSLADADVAVPLPPGVAVAGGLVHAAMLDTRASWDAFVSRVAPDAASRGRILGNRVYRAFSRTLARSHAYVAMERLHHVLGERDERGGPRWDLVVLDTPPTRSALDVLDAPSSLARFVDERVAGVFLGTGALGASAASRAAARALGWIMGERLAAELAEFLQAFAPLRAGFAARAREVHAELLAPHTAFLLAAAPLAAHLDDADFLRTDLARRGVALRAALFNRAFHVDPARLDRPIDRAERWDDAGALALLARAPGGSTAEARAVIDAARASRRRALADDLRAEAAIDALLAEARLPLALALPLLPREPTSPAELLALAAAARPIDR